MQLLTFPRPIQKRLIDFPIDEHFRHAPGIRGSAFHRPWAIAGVCMAAVFGLVDPCLSAPVLILGWNRNPESNVTAYRLSYGTRSGQYSNTVETSATTASVAGLQVGQRYYFAVRAVNQAGLQSNPSNEISYQIPVTPDPPTGGEVPKGEVSPAGWTLRYVDSEETPGYRAFLAFDGDPQTFWHTAWTAGTKPPPHELQIDLGAVQLIGGFRYLPRQDSYTVGNIARYEFYVSMDGSSWGSAAATGVFANSKAEKTVTFTSRSGRYVRLRQITEVNGYEDCNVAELSLVSGTSTPPAPVNQAPVAAARSLTTTEDKAMVIALSASDSDGDPLAFGIVSGPLKGKLSGIAPNLTYTPDANANGTDSLRFRASDGKVDSNTATVSITITPVNDPPAASGQMVAGSEGQASVIVLAAADVDGDALTYQISSAPAKGALSGQAPNLTYTPKSGATGADSFTFKVSDGKVSSNTALVSINLAAKPPVSAGTLPLPWSKTLIGAANPAAESFAASGLFTVQGSGTLLGTADTGNFVWQTLSGSGEMIVRIDAMKNAGKSSRIGLMIRDSLAANAKHGFIGVDSAGGHHWIRRSRAGAASIHTAGPTGSLANLWLRLKRVGSTVVASRSGDGRNWQHIGFVNRQILTLGTNCYIGFSVSSGTSELCTATFSQVRAQP